MDVYLDRFPSLRLTVIGDVILDHYIWGDVGRISPEAPVPLMDVTHESHRLGGAANVALNLSAMGVQTALFGRAGGDPEGGVLLSLLSEAGIRWLGNLAAPAKATILKTRVVARNHQLCRLDREGRRMDYALDASAWEGLMDAFLESVDGILLSDYAKGVIDDAFLKALKESASRMRVPVFCDPKPRYGRDFSGMELLTPNRSEAIALSGVEWDSKEPFPAEAVIEGIHRRFQPRFLVVTMGEEGMLYAENGRLGGIVTTFAREVFDVSGAGDTVIAVLSASLLAGASLGESVKIANAAAGVVVGKVGTASVNREELSDTLRHLNKAIGPET